MLFLSFGGFFESLHASCLHSRMTNPSVCTSPTMVTSGKQKFTCLVRSSRSGWHLLLLLLAALWRLVGSSSCWGALRLVLLLHLLLLRGRAQRWLPTRNQLIATAGLAWVHGRLASISTAQTIRIANNNLARLLSANCLANFIPRLGRVLVQKVLLRW